MFTKYKLTDFEGLTIRNILERFIIYSETIGNKQDIFMDYLITGWEAPETVAYNVYKSCDYEWAVLIANNIVNPYYDWLLKDNELRHICESIYGDKLHDIHHYELNGLIYSSEQPGARKISNWQYEHDLNEKKRKIRVIMPSLINRVRDVLLKNKV